MTTLGYTARRIVRKVAENHPDPPPFYKRPVPAVEPEPEPEPSPFPQRLHVGHIIIATCKVTGVSTFDLTGKQRTRRIIEARWCVYWLARELTTQSFPEIANVLGKAHSGISDAVKVMQKTRGMPIRKGYAHWHGVWGVVADVKRMLRSDFSIFEDTGTVPAGAD